MNCNHRCYECHIPACPDRIRQSIGPRIIPMFADPPEWSADKVYSPLTLVIHNGATFMSRRCVPANTPLPTENPFYNESWVMVYDMNAQVAQYREEVAQLSQQVTDFSGKVDSWEQMIVEWTALISNWSSQFPEFTKDLAAIAERVATLETEMDQAQQDITALQATQQTHTEQIAANTQAIANLTPRVQAAEEHLTELDAEQQNQDDRLNNLDEGQNLQNTQIKALQDADTEIKQNVSANTTQIAENAEAIAANAAEIAKHAERLETLETSQGEQDTKIQANADAIAQHTIDIGQAKAAAQQAQDTATHANSVAQAAQELAQQAKDAADAAAGDLSGVTDRVQALETSQGTQDGKITALETSQGTQDGKISALETAQTQTAQDIADLKDGSTELPYVKKVNGSATGTLAVENLTVSGTATVGEPVNDTDAASKQYVDQAVQDATGGITPDVTQLKTDVEALQQSQSTQDGKITALENAQSEQEGRLDNLENGTTALPYIKDTGDTVTGTYDFTGADLTVKTPTADASPATKAYVDSKITNLENGSTALPYVKKTGDAMTGVLNMSNNKVTNVADPTADGDAVNYKTMNAMKTDLESQIENLSGLLDAANQTIQDLEQRVEELEQNPPQPVDPTTKFNQIDLSNYVGSLSGSTVNTASDFRAALQYILDNNPRKHFYYGTDHAGTTWYFASDTELSALSNDSYTCGNGVQNNGTAVQETFKMNKYVEPTPNLPDESGDYPEYKHPTTVSDNPDYKQTIIATMKQEQGAQSNPFEAYTMNIQKVTPTQLNTILNSANLFNRKCKQIAKSDSSFDSVWYGHGATNALKSVIHAGDTVYWLDKWNNYGNDRGSDNVFFIMIPTDDGNWNIATLWGTHD